VAENRPSSSNRARPEDLARVATQNLNNVPSESAAASFPEPIREYIGGVRLLLNAAAQSANMSADQIDRIGVETEWAMIATRILMSSTTTGRPGDGPQAVPALQQCFGDCERQHSRCTSRIEPGDRIGGYICNLEAAICVGHCLQTEWTGAPTRTPTQ
jgi:hypothetical protein